MARDNERRRTTIKYGIRNDDAFRMSMNTNETTVQKRNAVNIAQHFTAGFAVFSRIRPARDDRVMFASHQTKVQPSLRDGSVFLTTTQH